MPNRNQLGYKPNCLNQNHAMLKW